MNRDFIAESGLRRARRYVDAELLGKSEPADLAWLHHNPLLWLRALQCIRLETQNHIAKQRASIDHLKPASGKDPSQEYLDAKREVESKTTSRLHFIQLVERHIEEVKAIIGPQPFPRWLIVGDLIATFTEIAVLADSGELEAAADKANWHAKALKRMIKQRGGS